MNSPLFEPIRVGNLQLPHRIVMAPLTRSRAGQPGNIPVDINVQYYQQRAGAALIITEATQISQQGQGYAWTPGIHSQEQVEGWRKVAAAVHAEGGRIFLQLWHVGRISHQVFQPNGGLPVAPSAQAAPGKTFIIDDQGRGVWGDGPVPEALTFEGINQIVADYRQAARNAISAGVDGVEIHAGNGYLLDQFINSNSNHRDDQYGGSFKNRARLLLEVVDAVSDEVGRERVGVRLTPLGRFMGMGDNTPTDTFGYIASQLNLRRLAYLHLVEPEIVGVDKDENYDPEWDRIIHHLRSLYQGILILAGGYTKSSAEQALLDGRADVIAFGRPFISNPDLPTRFRLGAPLSAGDPSLYFGGGEQGYIDYPSLDLDAWAERQVR